MKWIFYLLPLLAGMCMATQSGINSQLKITINNAWNTVLVSFFIGFVAILFIVLVSKQPIPDFKLLQSVPLYQYLGGLLGVCFVSIAIVSAPVIGAAPMFALIIGGQLLAALCFDHFGLIGFKTNPISLIKVVGILMVIAGAYLIIKK
jgi:transporter family-2 protein